MGNATQLQFRNSNLIYNFDFSKMFNFGFKRKTDQIIINENCSKNKIISPLISYKMIMIVPPDDKQQKTQIIFVNISYLFRL